MVDDATLVIQIQNEGSDKEPYPKVWMLVENEICRVQVLRIKITCASAYD